MKPFYNSQVEESEVYEKVSEIIKNTRLIKDREAALLDLLSEYTISKPVGSGGVGKVYIDRHKFIYVQIGCGLGKWNYASLIKIGHMRETIGNDSFLGLL